QQRLHYLKNYWMEKVKSLPGVKLRTSFDPRWACAIGCISIEGKEPVELGSFLFEKYKIHTSSFTWENISGVRITPNVFTTTKNLDKLVEAITAFGQKK
ncbi:MAG: aminotransferase, partial [Terrimonas sp.]|nr:aminotransferase [Terrimonas sp.]